MPTVGSFHRFYWKSRPNVPAAPGVAVSWIYPQVQSVQASMSMGMAIWGVPFDAVRPIWRQVRWLVEIARRLWYWRSPSTQEQLETWIARIEALTPEQALVLDRVCEALSGPYWDVARREVLACATSPKFHQPEQWVAYSRALKANAGQAQNVFRHVKVVHALREKYPVSNPEAHLVTELAYQGLAARGRGALRG